MVCGGGEGVGVVGWDVRGEGSGASNSGPNGANQARIMGLWTRAEAVEVW